MATTTFSRIWKNEYIQTAIMIVAIILVVFGFWYGSQMILHTQHPALTVASGSMCKTQWMHCDGWSHPFDRTLHVGDLIIIQGVSAEDIHAAPEPEGDIIVFRQMGSDELIVHRAIANAMIDGKLYFQTKGDGNGIPDENTPSLPADRVIGKVVMRIPWIGHLALWVHDSSAIFIILLLIALIIVIEIIRPLFTRRKPEAEQVETP